MKCFKTFTLFALALLLCVGGMVSAKEQPIIVNLSRLDKAHKEIKKGTPEYVSAYKKLLADADKELKRKNPNVMGKPFTAPTGDKHDYVSLGRYYWPNPDTPDGLPYISKDGQSNPELDKFDRNRLSELDKAVQRLSLAYYLSGEKKYAEKAVSMLRTWFLDPETRTNPNLQHGQMRPGVNTGSSGGLLDGYSYVYVLDAIALLDQRGGIPKEDLEAIRAWFKELSRWMIESERGKKQAASKNNHAIAYDAELVRFLLFAGETDTAKEIIAAFPERRLAPQIKEDGSQPQELRRTNAMGYSNYNLEHILDIADMAHSLGIDLYNSDRNAADRAIRFLIPFMGNQESFPYKQISGWSGEERRFAKVLYRASAYSSHADEYLSLYERLKPSPESYQFILLYLAGN